MLVSRQSSVGAGLDGRLRALRQPARRPRSALRSREMAASPATTMASVTKARPAAKQRPCQSLYWPNM